MWPAVDVTRRVHRQPRGIHAVPSLRTQQLPESETGAVNRAIIPMAGHLPRTLKVLVRLSTRHLLSVFLRILESDVAYRTCKYCRLGWRLEKTVAY